MDRTPRQGVRHVGSASVFYTGGGRSQMNGRRTRDLKRRQRPVAPAKDGQQTITHRLVGDLLERTGLRAAAAGIPTGNVDAALLRLCAEFHEIASDVRAAEDQLTDAAGAEAERLWRACARTLWRDYDALVERIIIRASHTAEGLRAKGGVLRAVLALSAATTNGQMVELAAPHERLSRSLLDDLLRTEPGAP